MVPFDLFSHVSVAVSDLEKTKAFYGGVLGLPEIPRPDFPFPGVWYGLGGDLQPHVIVNESRRVPPVQPDDHCPRSPARPRSWGAPATSTGPSASTSGSTSTTSWPTRRRSGCSSSAGAGSPE